VIVSLIVAMDEQGGIGKDGKIPWHLSDDLKRFKALTMGHHMIMGRKTCESIGRALPGRTSIVLTRFRDYQFPGCIVVRSLVDALELAESHGESEVFVIGGGEVYALALREADRIYLTRVHATIGCDVFFPKLDMDHWTDVQPVIQSQDEVSSYSFSFHVLERA
jgi:dihydrofolate reductase